MTQRDPRPPTRFRLGPLDVTVSGADGAVVDRVAQLFRWSSRPADDAPPGWRVQLASTPAPPPPAHASSMSLEFAEAGRFAPLPGAAGRTVWVGATGSAVDVFADQRLVRISNDSDRMLTVDTYRVVRQLMLADAVASGYRPFHASAVVVDGRGVALVGEKGTGKTTMSAQLCLGGAAAHLANDKLLVGPGGHAVHFPEAPAVMRSTIEILNLTGRYDELRERGRFDAGETFLDHPLPPPLADIDQQAKVMFSEREYTELLTCEGRNAAQLDMVVELGGEDEAPGPVTGELSRHYDDLEPFVDWLGVRQPFPGVDLAGVPVVRVPRAGGVQATAARILELVG